MDSIVDVLREKAILTVYELSFAERLKELFRKLQSEAPKTFLPVNLESNYTDRRGKTKRLLPSSYSRTITNKNSLANGLQKAYNCLTEMKLLPKNLENMIRPQVRQYVQNLISLYVVDKRHLFPLYY